MCGRFTLYAEGELLAGEFGVPVPSAAGAPGYNIAPSRDVAAVRAGPAPGSREIARLRWGLVPLLVPYPPEGMVAWPVSPRVNSPSNDDEACVAPLTWPL